MSFINEIVAVNAFYFAGGQGRHAVRLFDMDDGEHTYRLRLEHDIWTLVGTR